MTPKMTAGRRLRTQMKRALDAASKELGHQLEFDEREQDALNRAAAAADRAAELRRIFEAEQAGEARPAVLVKLSAEMRALDKQVVDLLAKLSFGPGQAGSERHRQAARARWDRRDARWGIG